MTPARTAIPLLLALLMGCGQPAHEDHDPAELERACVLAMQALFDEGTLDAEPQANGAPIVRLRLVDLPGVDVRAVADALAAAGLPVLPDSEPNTEMSSGDGRLELRRFEPADRSTPPWSSAPVTLLAGRIGIVCWLSNTVTVDLGTDETRGADPLSGFCYL